MLNLSDSNLDTSSICLFSGVSGLEELHLKNVGLTYLQPNAFSNFNELKVLDISYNQVNSFDLKLQFRIGQLKEMYLHGNDFDEISNYKNLKTVFPNLEIISIDASKYQCDNWKLFFKTVRAMKIRIKQIGNCLDSVSSTKRSATKSITLSNLNQNLEDKINRLESQLSDMNNKLNSLLEMQRAIKVISKNVDKLVVNITGQIDLNNIISEFNNF